MERAFVGEIIESASRSCQAGSEIPTLGTIEFIRAAKSAVSAILLP